jgi:hypothetical protein
VTNIISTWFYTQGQDEGGRFAQIREDSATERFRDIYRRCIGVFFASARRANPDGRLVLYLNKPWEGTESSTSRSVGDLLTQLGVEKRVIAYDHAPPASFTDAWRNQFFVIDVLMDLQQRLSPNDLAVILDSDILWTSASKATLLWSTIRKEGLACYEVGYDVDHRVNGLSINDLRHLTTRLGITPMGRLSYCGGEFIAGTHTEIRRLSSETSQIWSQLMDLHRADSSLAFEEAHILSMAYSLMGHQPGTADAFIRRLWTQPMKPRNVTPQDLRLSLWHVPAEKKYGLARLYKQLQRRKMPDFLSLSDVEFTHRMGDQVGIPRNSIQKTIIDVGTATLMRISNQLRGSNS